MAVPQNKFKMNCIFIQYLFDEYLKNWEVESEDRKQFIFIQEFECRGLTFKSRPGFHTAKAKVCDNICSYLSHM